MGLPHVRVGRCWANIKNSRKAVFFAFDYLNYNILRDSSTELRDKSQALRDILQKLRDSSTELRDNAFEYRTVLMIYGTH